jgi:hypothetical protein
MATVSEAEREVLELYRKLAPNVGDIIQQHAFLEHARKDSMSWVELARGVDHLVAQGHLKPVSGPPYGWNSRLRAKLVAALEE